jgi:hypothetical protein
MIGLLINPNSRKNRHRRSRVGRFTKILGRHGTVIETPSVDSIIPALRTFADEGRRYWVADGGDGALHWMLNEAVRYFGLARAKDIAVYMPTGGGTIDFVARVLGMKDPPEALVTRLVQCVAEKREPEIVDVPTLVLTGHQVEYGDEVTPFRRVGFGCALAGYGANFFGPLYRGNKEYGGPRIAKLLAAAFSAAALRGVLQGPLESLKPERMKSAERDFLRQLRAVVRIDGTLLRGEDGEPVRSHTVLHCASVPINLAEILRVFPAAGDGKMHVHAGHVSAAEMARIFPGLMTGRSVHHLLHDAYDGPGTTLDVQCDAGEEMTPVIDGEIFHRINELHVAMGPRLRMAVP